MIEREIPSWSASSLYSASCVFGDERTNDQQKSIRLCLQSNGESPEQIVDALKGVQDTGIHYDRAAVDLILLPKFFGRRIIEHRRLDAGRHHVDFRGRTPWSTNQSLSSGETAVT